MSEHMGIAEQLGVFFPKVASAARAKKTNDVKARKEKEAEAKKASQAKLATEEAAIIKKEALSSDGVTRREMLWAGGGNALFSVKIPETAEYKVGVNGGNDYLHFFRPVKGGVVNIHVYHPNNPRQFLGEKVICTMRIWIKHYEDGREYIYLDLFILPRETEAGSFPSHEWRVVQGRDPIAPKGMMNVYHFPTPEPLDGAIVVGEIPPKFK